MTSEEQIDPRLRRRLRNGYMAGAGILTVIGLLIGAYVVGTNHDANQAQQGQASAEATASSYQSRASGIASTVSSVKNDNAVISAALAAFAEVCRRNPIPAKFIGPCAQAHAAGQATPITVTNRYGATLVVPATPVTVSVPKPELSLVTLSVDGPTSVVQRPGVTVTEETPVTVTQQASPQPTAVVTIVVDGTGISVVTVTATATNVVNQAPVTITQTVTVTPSRDTTTLTSVDTQTVTVTQTVTPPPSTTTATERTTETATATATATVTETKPGDTSTLTVTEPGPTVTETVTVTEATP